MKLAYLDISELRSILRAAVSLEFASRYAVARVALAHEKPWQARCWDWTRKGREYQAE